MRHAFTVGAVLAMAMLGSEPALACGGTFCDNPPILPNQPPPPPPMPVDQSGEVIAFALDGTHVEAHIQIEYTGDPARFAWVIPLPSEPEFSVGSQALFLNLLNGTVPTFSLTTTFDACSGGARSSSSPPSLGCGSSDSSEGFALGAGGTPDASSTHSPQVAGHEQVGAFDVVVLRGDPSEVTAWLTDNDYLVAPGSLEVLQRYAARGHVFAAVKLVPGVGVNEIHPLVVRYEGNEPCIPIELTAVAALENMSIRAFFLGQRRTVPTGGYKHVTLAAPSFDFLGLGANYDGVVTRAVDSAVANGRAFVTEYAGSSAVVRRTNLDSTGWNASVFETLDALQVPTTLMGQGLLACAGATCSSPSVLLGGLLSRYLPVPTGYQPGGYYGCISCAGANADLSHWDGPAFAADLDAEIINPTRHANALLDTYPYVTRLFTKISPNEMTEDPTFAELPSAGGNVSATLAATLRTTCSGSRVIELPDGRGIEVVANLTAGPILDTPAAELIEQYEPDGTRVVLVDNGPAIDDGVQAVNDAIPGSPAPLDSGPVSSGCGCAVRGRSGGIAFVAASFMLLGMLRRASARRRR